MELFTSGPNAKNQGGVPAYGNLPDEWDAGCTTGMASPEHKR